jgi:hypothetical protein
VNQLESLLWTAGGYGVSALLGAGVVWAIVPRQGRGPVGVRRLGLWLVASSLAGGAIFAFRSLAGHAQSFQMWLEYRGQTGADGGLAALVVNGIFALVTIVLAYLLAALLYRRLGWPEVARRTGWRLDGWRRWVVYLLAAGFFAWPVSLLTWLLQVGWAVRGAASAATDLYSGYLVLLWLLIFALSIAVAGWVLWCLPAADDGAATATTDGSRVAWWLAFIGGVGVLSTGLESAYLALEPMIRVPLQVRASPDLAPTGWAWLVEPLLVLGIILLPLLYLRRPAWRWLDHVTGRAWTTAGKVLAALTLGAWLSWPVTAAARLADNWTAAAWPLVGVLLVLAAVVFVLLYRPGAAPEDTASA